MNGSSHSMKLIYNPYSKSVVTLLYITEIFFAYVSHLNERFTSAGTREQAYVYAMSAAALAWSVARACAAGSLPACSCAAPPRAPPRPPRQAQVTPAEPHARFKWGGCGDNYQWAERYVKK